jgi:hypothetical protein
MEAEALAQQQQQAQMQMLAEQGITPDMVDQVQEQMNQSGQVPE